MPVPKSAVCSWTRARILNASPLRSGRSVLLIVQRLRQGEIAGQISHQLARVDIDRDPGLAGSIKYAQLDRAGSADLAQQLTEQRVVVFQVNLVGQARELTTDFAGSQVDEQLTQFNRIGQRGFHLDIQPAVDGLVQKLNCKQVQDHDRRQCQGDEDGNQAGGKAGTRLRSPEPLNQADQAAQDHDDQDHQRDPG